MFSKGGLTHDTPSACWEMPHSVPKPAPKSPPAAAVHSAIVPRIVPCFSLGEDAVLLEATEEDDVGDADHGHEDTARERGVDVILHVVARKHHVDVVELRVSGGRQRAV